MTDQEIVARAIQEYPGYSLLDGFGDIDITVTEDAAVVARTEHRCHTCFGEIAPRSLCRSTKLVAAGYGRKTHYHCVECCAAMITDDGEPFARRWGINEGLTS